MAAVDLSEHDIDQLLSSAELSLAGKQQADQAVAVKGQQHLTLAPKPPSPPTALADKAGKKLETPELSLRVPRIRSRDKKVRAPIRPQPASPMRKFYPKLE